MLVTAAILSLLAFLRRYLILFIPESRCVRGNHSINLYGEFNMIGVTILALRLAVCYSRSNVL